VVATLMGPLAATELASHILHTKMVLGGECLQVEDVGLHRVHKAREHPLVGLVSMSRVLVLAADVTCRSKPNPSRELINSPASTTTPLYIALGLLFQLAQHWLNS